MDYKSVAEQFTKNKAVHIPDITIANSSNIEVNMDEFSTLMKTIEDGRTAAFTATKAVANGADPNTIETKCYMPDCYGNGIAKFSNFKEPINIKEYMMSGMCQTCQECFFD
jgi:hypothetical protein